MRHQLTEPASGAASRLRVGDTLEVRLRQIGGTGYLWDIDSLPAALRFEDDQGVISSTGAVGGAALRTLVFKAVDQGEGLLVLRLARPWEDAVEEQLSLAVSVSA